MNTMGENRILCSGIDTGSDDRLVMRTSDRGFLGSGDRGDGRNNDRDRGNIAAGGQGNIQGGRRTKIKVSGGTQTMRDYRQEEKCEKFTT